MDNYTDIPLELTPELYNNCLYFMDKRDLAESTKVRYTRELDSIFKNRALDQRLYNKLHSKRGIYRSILKLIMDVCKHFDIPIYKYKVIKTRKKEKRLPQFWNESSILKMAGMIEDYDLLILCAYYIGAGLRFSSAIMLSWENFNWEDWIIDKSKMGRCDVLAKGDNEKLLYVDPILMNKLHNIAVSKGKAFQGIPYKNSAEDKYLFIKRVELEALQGLFRKQNFDKILDSDGNQIKVNERARNEIIRKKHYLVDHKLKKLSKSFKEKIKFHSIRHSRATNLLEKEFKPLTIKKQLMHKSFSSTEIYLNLVNKDIEKEFEEKL